MSNETDLHHAMIKMYPRVGTETGYWGNYFLRSVRTNGGLATAKRMLKPSKGATRMKGFVALVKARRADLSVEALVTKKLFSELFTKEELKEARRRLTSLHQLAWPKKVRPDDNFPETQIGSLSFRDGGVRRVVVNAYERDPRARNACLRTWGTACVVCKMSFHDRYGTRGKDFIHVHHLDPLGRRKRRKRIDPTHDLVPVCPNCHAMLHTTDPPVGIAELIAELKGSSAGL